MKAVVSRRWPVVRNLAFFFVSLCLAACSIPNLDPSECTESRDVVKEFYSWYFATDAANRDKSPEMFDKFVSPGTRAATNDVDPFVLTNDFPKAFRIGECKVLQPGKETQFEVL